jgi:hypothetical protein
MASSKTTCLASISIPEIGLFLFVDTKGRLYKKKIWGNERSPRSGWLRYDEDLILLALEGKTEELNAVQELMSKVPA